jgi:hypothetical protein
MSVFKFLTYQASRSSTDNTSEHLETALTIVLVAFLSSLTVMVLL